MNPIISIIVPVFKAEKYLSKCIDSILAQTFKNFELILIDDGSPDSSGRICDDYALRDDRIYVIHQVNSGASAARNVGLKVAKGEWIGFVDSDDWIEPETYEVALNAALMNNAELVQWGIFIDVEGVVVKTKEYRKGIFYPKTDATCLEPSMCHKLVSRKLICDRQIRFPEKLTLSEDRYFAFLCYLYSVKNYALENNFYHYRMNSDSSTHNMTEKNLQDEISVIKLLENAVSKSGKKSEWEDIIIEQKIVTKNHCLLLLKKPDCKLWRETFKEINKQILKYGGIKKILYLFILLHFDFLISILFHFYKKN